MAYSDIGSVESAQDFSHGLLTATGVFMVLLVLSRGPSTPVWMFVNSLQLLAYVVLVPTKIPGNAHHFLLDLLDTLRLHLFGLYEVLAKTT